MPHTTASYLVSRKIQKLFCRGHGLLAKLYHETRNQLPSGYQLCVTDVSVRNSKSLKAHEKMGFEVIGTYHDGKELWNIIAWDLYSFS